MGPDPICIVLAVWMDRVAHLFHYRIRGSVMGWTWGGAAVMGIVLDC